ncbi:unnamed protein product [Cuscuta epithymum]|uniref:Uncharacterized protein n=1 Tax=Cuscuta epithymum TaxID=186058 RepID=A0AAV0F642_9ASTE|nr:unnamed protein product [Cuscuta epithymum]
MEESSFHLIVSKQFPSTLLNFLQHCHNKITPSKMFFTMVLILSFSSILCLLRLHQGLSCMNNQRKVMAQKKSNNYLEYIVLQIRVWLYKFFLGLDMAIGTCIGVSPFSFRRRKFSALIEEKEMLEENNKIDNQVIKPNIDEETTDDTTSNDGKKFNGFMERKLCQLPKEFMVLTEIRNKTLIMRDLLDLSPCNGSTSLHDLLILTLKDLSMLYPSAKQIEMDEIEELTMDQVLKSFCNGMKSIANTWTGNDEWMIKCNVDMFNLETNNLELYALAMLEDMIKLTGERMFAEEEEMVDSPNSFSRLLFEPSSPLTPTSVLPEVCNTTHKRIGRLNPIDNQHLTFNMSPHTVVQDSKYMVHITNTSKTLKKEDFQVKIDEDDMLYSPKDVIAKMEAGREESFKKNQIDGSIVQLIPTCITMDMVLQTPSLTKLRRNAQKEELTFTISFNGVKPQTSMSTSSMSNFSSNLKPTQSPPPPPSPLPIITKHVSLPQTLPPPPPPPPPPQQTSIIKSTNITSPPPPLPLPIRPNNMTLSPPLMQATRNLPPPTPPPPPPMISCNLVSVSPPPPPPPMISCNFLCVSPPPPPSPLPYPNVRDTIQQSHSTVSSNGVMSVPPPPIPMGKGVLGPPPPPPLIGTKSPHAKKGSKLKRSSQMGNLYRFLKVKVEGSNLETKLGRKGKISSSSGGKQGMTDALVEMTKRSTYFQQIEEDVKKHATEIKEMTMAITNFQTSDMTELIQFHKHVESHLEKLTDESQVLARFEDFPTKKLEALRMAATLYNKLDVIACTLKKWPKESPVSQLLDKSESYINKIKGDLEKIEQSKDEEEKKYASHKINFDFSILVRIKEFMVDVSSNCMELALKEWRDSNAREKKCDEVSNNRQKNGTPD